MEHVAVDVRAFVDWVESVYLPACRVDAPTPSYGLRPGDRRANVYGLAEAVNLTYTIGGAVDDAVDVAAAFEELRDPATGHYREVPPTHHELHATAYSMAAMRLAQVELRTDPEFLEPLRPVDAIAPFLSTIDWRNDVYLGSHRGAGLGSIVALIEPDADAWFDAYFAHLDSLLDPRSGLHGLDKPATGDTDQIGGTFHYAFLYEHLDRPLAHPEARIEAVLGARRPDGWWHPENHLWLTLDAVYLLTRACAQTSHRRRDVEDTVAATVAQTFAHFGSIDGRRHFEEWYLGAHDLTALISLAAEAQRFTGGDGALVDAGRTLRLVLDERPFI